MRSCAAVSVLFILILPISITRSQDSHHLIDDLDIYEDQDLSDTLGPVTPYEQRASFIQWILQFILGYTPNKPTVHPPPQPIDQSKCSPCKCGITKKQDRIVGGHVTYVNQYPWMCLLMYRGKFYCGCTLINSKYVMTASHCVHGFGEEKISVRCYDHDRESDNETQHVDRKVSRIVAHSGYSEYSFNNDIALIALDKEIPIDEQLLPVCLPPAKKNFVGETGIVTGWGVKKAGGATSATLQEVKVPIMSNKDCKNSSYGSSRITENMMCAGYPEGKKDSCQGDSGGPLHVVLDDSVHHIAGVVSWGEGCAQADHPGVYTRVNRYLTWIQKNTQDACYCKTPGNYQSTTSTTKTTTSSTYAPPAPVTENVAEKL